MKIMMKTILVVLFTLMGRTMANDDWESEAAKEVAEGVVTLSLGCNGMEGNACYTDDDCKNAIIAANEAMVQMKNEELHDDDDRRGLRGERNLWCNTVICSCPMPLICSVCPPGNCNYRRELKENPERELSSSSSSDDIEIGSHEDRLAKMYKHYGISLDPAYRYGTKNVVCKMVWKANIDD
mmetsp:Transcript_14789/g.28137  ORF Transcript_14789/g.28137 Transcript_14789/m.28137 type:complete len:182 (+) Transcript_14789:350-895(+)|eukprot:scaffold336_cov196-Amphora_coffeaeformis.AAC.9